MYKNAMHSGIVNQENHQMELSSFVFVFDIAKTVLAKVISDLITDKIKEVRKAEIKKEVAAAILEEKSLVKHQDLKPLLRQVMDEIEILSGRDPDLKVSSDYTIELAKPVRKLRLPLVEKDINQELHERLQRLDEIIAQRRKEVELPTQSEELSVQWKYVHKQQENNHWEQEIMDMENRIRRRRTGEVLPDE